MRDICNSLICVNTTGQVGIVSEIDNANANFYPFNPDGSTTDYIVTPLVQLKQAKLSQIPTARRNLADVQLIELGYVDSPAAAPVATPSATPVTAPSAYARPPSLPTAAVDPQ